MPVFILAILVVAIFVWRTKARTTDEAVSTTDVSAVQPKKPITDLQDSIPDSIKVIPAIQVHSDSSEIVTEQPALEAPGKILKTGDDIDVGNNDILPAVSEERGNNLEQSVGAVSEQESTQHVYDDDVDDDVVSEPIEEVPSQMKSVLSADEQIELKAEDGYTCFVTLMPDSDGVIVVELDDETRWAIPEEMARPFISSPNLTDDQKIDAILTYPSLIAVTPEFEAMDEQEQMEYMELMDPPEFTNHIPDSLTGEVDLSAPVIPEEN